MDLPIANAESGFDRVPHDARRQPDSFSYFTTSVAVRTELDLSDAESLSDHGINFGDWQAHDVGPAPSETADQN